MDVKQKVDNKGDDVTIDGNPVPVIITRDFNASISVNDGRTIVIGGIVSEDKRKTRSKVPFLGDIPLLGYLFRSDDIEEKRVELMVMLTPYVLDTPEEAYAETARRQASLSSISNMWVQGWSPSDLAAPSPEQVRAQRRQARKTGDLPPEEEVIPYKPDSAGEAGAATPVPVQSGRDTGHGYQMRISNSPSRAGE